MKRIISRVYEIHQRDINEAILAWLRAKDRDECQLHIGADRVPSTDRNQSGHRRSCLIMEKLNVR